MAIIDCFYIDRDNVNLVYKRFEYLSPFVDAFVVVEDTRNKVFDSNITMFAPYCDDCRYVAREFNSDDEMILSMMEGLKKIARKGDYVLVSRYNEFWSPEVVLDIVEREENAWVTLQHNVQGDVKIPGTAMGVYGLFKDTLQLKNASKREFNLVQDGGRTYV